MTCHAKKELSNQEIIEMCAPDQRWGGHSYAQHGDDFMLMNLFEQIGIDKPSYLDIGAHHPFIISNTWGLYKRGSRGVNVEANPNLMTAFYLYRQEDINLNLGVGLSRGVYPFFMFDDYSGRNTLCKKEAEIFLKNNPKFSLNQVFNINTVTINELIQDYLKGIYPDLLSIDIEGYDFAVLNSADFSKSRPKIIIAEVRRESQNQFKTMLEEKGFRYLIRMGENCFFIHSDYLSMVL